MVANQPVGDEIDQLSYLDVDQPSIGEEDRTADSVTSQDDDQGMMKVLHLN